MNYIPRFTGFQVEAVNFLKNLRKNNSKLWFDTNKDIYIKYLKEPAENFVMDMGERLSKFAPNIIADPRTNQSIFRIYRDARYSQGKPPYKTHLGIYFWEGLGPKLECSGFYFHLEPPTILLGAGIYIFTPQMLKAYRKAVIDPKFGKKLAVIIKGLNKKKYEIVNKHYKRVPRGFNPKEKNVDLLLYNGLTTWIEMKIPKEFFRKNLISLCERHFKNMLPLHQWLVEVKNKFLEPNTN